MVVYNYVYEYAKMFYDYNSENDCRFIKMNVFTLMKPIAALIDSIDGSY